MLEPFVAPLTDAIHRLLAYGMAGQLIMVITVLGGVSTAVLLARRAAGRGTLGPSRGRLSGAFGNVQKWLPTSTTSPRAPVGAPPLDPG